uniref:Uncharacterized protein n=1 Tax=Trichogramma kaykai TaxID=54128 RepID=A0ABD2XQA9_9HYME
MRSDLEKRRTLPCICPSGCLYNKQLDAAVKKSTKETLNNGPNSTIFSARGGIYAVDYATKRGRICGKEGIKKSQWTFGGHPDSVSPLP